tara:strand:- start:475 stop:807 length:333 start_codon:yes stop_codon:yes gene_type:complete
MSLETYSTQIIEGEHLTLPIKWTVKETGAPIDLTGSTLSFEAKDPDYDMPAIITNAVEGEYNFRLQSVATAGKVTKGGQISLDYLVKHENSTGEINYIYRIQVKVVGAHD